MKRDIIRRHWAPCSGRGGKVELVAGVVLVLSMFQGTKIARNKKRLKENTRSRSSICCCCCCCCWIRRDGQWHGMAHAMLENFSPTTTPPLLIYHTSLYPPFSLSLLSLAMPDLGERTREMGDKTSLEVVFNRLIGITKADRHGQHGAMGNWLGRADFFLSCNGAGSNSYRLSVECIVGFWLGIWGVFFFRLLAAWHRDILVRQDIALGTVFMVY
ncbi:hypothetical protein BDP55DRAFT_58663 [Colletotrichum godetiae]|uniref:Uncharacterized protein n=1 Tax=Colletotrichum godetiae TaxID=1209918 RepID=A0AAJ0APV2_9PEZI|nr:uncharacterized protein BDP55DRAFT_58663 [Colletotrichum godetiae]KAK1688173.1 hypothetical protein BDP55DRAFT_58663 [Colletotrichum godetiae]